MEVFLSDAQDSNMRRDAISDISDDLKYIADRTFDERKNSCFASDIVICRRFSGISI